MAPDCNSQSLQFTGKSFMKSVKIPKNKKKEIHLNHSLVDVPSSGFQMAVGVSTLKCQPVATDDVHEMTELCTCHLLRRDFGLAL